MDLIRNIMDRILFEAKKLCESNNSKFIVVFHPDEKNNLATLCKDICLKYNILLLNLNENLPKQQYFLEKDGHYSQIGNKWIAESIRSYLRKNNLLLNN